MSDVLDRPTFEAWVRTEISGDANLNQAAIDAATSYLGSPVTGAGRNFTLVDGDTVASARTFRPATHCTSVLWITDAAEITSVSENGTALTVDLAYIAEPNGNRDEASGQWRPYDRLYRLDSWWYHDGYRRTVTVTAKWGWTTFDPLIGEACKVLAQDWAAQRNSANGVIGATADNFSIGMRTNPLVMAAINALRGPMSIGIA